MEDEEALIDAEIQKQLDEISLADSESDEITEEEVSTQDMTEEDATDWVKLYIEKSSERSKATQNILLEAEDVLNQCNKIPKSNFQSEDIALIQENDVMQQEITDISLILYSTTQNNHESNLSCKSLLEIEKDNEEKLESLEKKLILEEENELNRLEKTKKVEEQQFLEWKNLENKMQTNVQLMLDKAQYWEKTYEEMAEEELMQKQENLLNEYTNSQRKIDAMQQEDEEFLQDLLREKEKLDSKKNNDAAVKIQKWYRGARVRKLYQSRLAALVEAQREKRKLEKIALLDKKKEEMKRKETEETSALKEDKEIVNRNPGIAPLESSEESGSHIQETSAEAMCFDESSDGKVEDSFEAREQGVPGNTVEVKLFLDSGSENSPEHNHVAVVESREETVVSVTSVNGSISCTSLLENEGFASHPICDDISKSFGNKENSNLSVANSSCKAFHSGSKKEIHNVDANLESVNETKDAVGNEEVDPVCPSVNTEESVEILNGDANDDLSPASQSSGISIIDIKDISSGAEPNTKIVPANDSITEREETKTSQSNAVYTHKLNLEPEETRVETQPCITILSHSDKENISGPSLVVTSETALEKSSNEFPLRDIPVKSSDVSGTQEPSEGNVCEAEMDIDSRVGDDTASATLSNPEEVLASGKDSSSDKNHFKLEGKAGGDAHIDSQDAPEDAIPLNKTAKVPSEFKSDILSDSVCDTTGQIVSITERDFGQIQPAPSGKSNVASTGKDSKVEVAAKSSPEACSEYFQIPDNPSSNTTSSFLLHAINHTVNSSIKRKAELQLNQNELRNEVIHLGESKRLLSDNFGDETSNQVTGISKEHPEPGRFEMSVEAHLPENEYKQGEGQSKTLGKPNTNATEIKQSKGKEDEASLEENLSKQHLKWLLKSRQKSKKSQEKQSASSPPKARKIIRKSSAAKKLLPFSQSELINGAYDPSTCKKENLTTSVEDVQAIFLSHIDGGRNLLSFCSCFHLSHLTIHECGLVSVENLQACPSLQCIDVSRNAINLLSCSGMKRLEALVVSHNQLTSIHGLDGCCSLLYVDFSQNNITKISGLEDAKNLMHLRITNNHLVNISGIRRCKKLIYLDVSENHLMSLDDLKECKVLTSVMATGNNLEEISEDFLNSLIFLTKLDVSRNSLQTLSFYKETWLPFLIDVRASVNRIGQDPLSSETLSPRLHMSAPCLSFIDLSNNLISDAKPLEVTVAKCVCLQKINLAGNPLDSDVSGNLKFWNSEVIFEEGEDNHVIPGSVKEILCPLHSSTKHFVFDMADGNKILSLIQDQTTNLAAEIQSHSQNISKCLVRWSKNKGMEEITDRKPSYPPHLLSLHAAHLKTLGNMLEFYRLCHENEDFHPAATEHGEVTNNNTLSHAVPDEESKVVKNSNLICYEEKYGEASTDSTKSQSQQKLRKALPPAVVKTPVQESSSNSMEISQKVSSAKSESMKNEQAGSLVASSSVVFEKLQMRNAAGIMEKYAATKMQSVWRGYRVRRVHTSIKKSRVEAAIKIQACWRGYVIRSKIQRAMQTYKENTEDIGFQEEFEDVDLDGFNFDENFYEMQWAHKVTSYPQRNFESPPDAAFPRKVDVWSMRKQTLDMAEPQQEKCFTKPPLPPIPKVDYTSGSETDGKHIDIQPVDVQSLAESQRSKLSAKQELLSNQWGIKSSSTADLMMKRARRMKGARKKIQTAEEKYARFQERTRQASGGTIASSRKKGPSNKVEYFHAKEMEFQAEDRVSCAEKEEKELYTYEWLHSQVGCHNDNPTKPSQKRQRPHLPATKRSTGFLPAIPRSPSLVSQHDLEVVSLTSGSSFTNRNKDRLRDIVRRHHPNYPGV